MVWSYRQRRAPFGCAIRTDPAKGFPRFTWLPIDLQYRVVGKFIKDAEPKPVKVPNTFGSGDKTEGVVEFAHGTDAAVHSRRARSVFILSS